MAIRPASGSRRMRESVGSGYCFTIVRESFIVKGNDGGFVVLSSFVWAPCVATFVNGFFRHVW